MRKDILLSSPSVGVNDLSYVKIALDDNELSPYGKYIDILQTLFRDNLYIDSDANTCFALKSGTAALHVAVILSNVAKGDVVLCQTSTFIASVNPILYEDAIPVFIDSEKFSWNMCPVLLEKAIIDCANEGVVPKAILIGCNYGMPCNYDKVLKLSKKYNIPLIEDSAAALGSGYKNKPCGSFGEYSIISLNSNKIITGSSGGVLCSKSNNVTDRVLDLISQGKINAELGYNYQMSNISAAIASSQFKELDKRINRKRAIYNFYYEHLSRYKGIEFVEEPEHSFSNRWLTTVQFESEKLRDKVLKELEVNNIESRKLWKPLHKMKKFQKYKVCSNGVAEELYSKGLCLPSGTSLSINEQNEVIKIIEKILS